MTLADTPRFVHFSVEPFHGPVRPVSINRQELHSKPRGFWISDESGEDGWADWCLGENFATEALSHAASIELADDAKLLWLKSDADIDHFSRQYGIPEHRFQRTYRVNWRPIAEEFQGIIITPYIWSRRLDDNCSWYYSWDCASGCIWDPAAIAGIAQTDAAAILDAIAQRNGGKG